MISIELCLGAPVIDPDGNIASKSRSSDRVSTPPFTVDVICHCSGYRSTSNNDVTWTLPMRAMRPMSLRTMSTIMTFSARFFSDWRSAFPSALSCSVQ